MTPEPPQPRWLTWLVIGTSIVLVLLCLVPFAYFAALGLFSPTFTGPRLVPTPVPLLVATAMVVPPTPVLSPTPPAWPTAGGDYETRWASMQSSIAQAETLAAQGRAEEAIALWDRILLVLPEHIPGYYARGLGHLTVAEQLPYALYSTAQEQAQLIAQYREWHWQALADGNQVIAHYVREDTYYGLRARALAGLARSAYYRAEQLYWYKQALADAQAAQLGEFDKATQLVAIEAHYALGQCAEGLAQAEKLAAGLGPAAATDAELQTAYTEGYLCQGDLAAALESVNRALLIQPSGRRQQLQWTILAQQGQITEALEILNDEAALWPDWWVCPTEWRVLLQLEQGNLVDGQALADSPCAERGGLRLYVEAKLALAQGDAATGQPLLQEAEASFWPGDSGWLLHKIQAELAALNLTPLTPPVDVSPTPTLLPVTPQPVHYPPPMGTPAVLTEAVSFELPGQTFGPVFHFKPATPVQMRSLISMTAILEGTGPITEAEIYIWYDPSGDWAYVPAMQWGANDVFGNLAMFMPPGELTAAIKNNSTQPLSITAFRWRIIYMDMAGETRELP